MSSSQSNNTRNAIFSPPSAYPPANWALSQPKENPFGSKSYHALWAEMTGYYQEEEVIKKMERAKINARKTIPKEKHDQMPGEMWEQFDHEYTEQDGIIYDRSVARLMRGMDEYQCEKEAVSATAMQSIPETSEVIINRGLTKQQEYEERVIRNKLPYICGLMMSDDILPSYHSKIRKIYKKYNDFTFTINKAQRPEFSELMIYDNDLKEAVQTSAKILKGDDIRLKDFLADCMHNEYLDQAKKDDDGFWIQMGTYIYWSSHKNSPLRDRELAFLAEDVNCTVKQLDINLKERLQMTIRRCKLDEGYVFKRIRDYYLGGSFGAWQACVDEGRWADLAKKLLTDRNILDLLIEGDANIPDNQHTHMSRKCRIATNIRLTRAKYFKKLESPTDFELSGVAKAIEKKRMSAEAERASAEGKKEAEFAKLLEEKLKETIKERSLKRRVWRKLSGESGRSP